MSLKTIDSVRAGSYSIRYIAVKQTPALKRLANGNLIIELKDVLISEAMEGSFMLRSCSVKITKYNGKQYQVP